MSEQMKPLPWRTLDDRSFNEGDKLIICTIHWKRDFPGSWEISGGEVWSDNNGDLYLTQIDEAGHGCQSWSLNKQSDQIDFWMFAVEARAFLPEPPAQEESK